VADFKERLQGSDAARFAGRESELSLLAEVLAGPGPAQVAFVHGEGGIGKSTLLRAAARDAAERGYEVFAVDGRELAPAPRELERALDGAGKSERPLILLDTYERFTALGHLLRSQILPRLPAATRVLIASRRPPEEGWLQDGWDAVTLNLPLEPLSTADSWLLLERRGVVDARVGDELVSWAGGSPLALAIAAEGLGQRVDPLPSGQLADDSRISAALVRRIVGDEAEGADGDVLAVAAIADRVDARLLGDVLPDVDGAVALTWLRRLSFVEPVGRGIALHERARQALAGELRAQEPGRERELRRRVADHLYSRGSAGEAGRFLEFGELVRNPAVRFGFGVQGSVTHRADIVRTDDVELAAAALGEGEADWWPRTRRWFEEAPETVMTVRDAAGNLAGFSITVLLADAPTWAADDPALAPVFAHARDTDPAATIVRRDIYDLTAGREGSEGSPVLALINAAFARQGDLCRVRRQYCVNDTRDRSTLAFNEAAGTRHLAELDRADGARRLSYHLLDYGSHGVMEAGRALVYRDLGLLPPAPEGPVSAAAVREALRAFHDPAALAVSPMARGHSTAERAEAVRRRLREATEAEFARSLAEQELRATIEWGYFDADISHTGAALRLSISRATYFRRLSEAVERVSVRLGE
jgi:hypothetical protein